MNEHLVEVTQPCPSFTLLEQPAFRPLLDHYSPVEQPADPLPERDTTSIPITNGQTMPPVTGFTLKSSKKGDNYERVWIRPSFIPKEQQTLQGHQQYLLSL